ncbi:hypothetical protein, partial [Amphritea pacifica]|uniref:hypothetical protein n=1 Tax=Amphritea pacifica TaxID=2811233 RepID=UPI001966536F
MFLPFFILMVIILPFIHEPITHLDLVDSIYILYVFLPSGLIWGYFEASGRGYLPMPWFMKAVKHFTFSRSTGMVTR